ncbi:MAG: FtsW/RodA/SpoVE family cell cycle protein [Ruminococcus sp.]|uniref:FtsW/RodA/SpoVE family cell cycle protein n=1 Tax=Ruminococcus sp. TaxID=41978 RepID=UPI0025DFF67D|nr:FtsW/RodA/SpoVE family cell cycle protein [Ruminococcus sp.]MCR5601867.1 FtsW/RodA/SpoVE family cell cycle protein [Ruminococcus sp.]
MYANPVAYIFSCLFVLIAHSAMLVNIWFNGNYSETKDIAVLGAAVIILDIAYFVIILFFKQSSYVLDFLLILVLNMSMIFQSCFGKVGFDKKHFITCIVCLAACKGSYILCKNHKLLQKNKKFIYAAIGVILLIMLLFTNAENMWLEIGPLSIQPSEFLKPLFVLACATSIADQQHKHKVLMFNVVYDNLVVFGIMAAICLVQVKSHDYGSLPTFVSIYAVGFLLRICYPKAKFSKKKLIAGIIAGIVCLCIALKYAPDYVQHRLHVDIWSDKTGDGYQQSQALIAIANGGWFGVGPGKGFLVNVFAHENDIVFATVSEEWGLFFSLMMILTIIVITAVPLINPARSYYHGTMSACISAAFIVQMALNIFGSCNLIPFTGVTVPFISEGGSSLMVCGIMVGMLIAAQSPVFKEPKQTKQEEPVPAWRWQE